MLIQIELLGGLRVLHDGVSVALPCSRKTRALLGYLAVTRRELHRDRLSSLLWEHTDSPRAQLRWCLCQVRKLVAGRLVTNRDHIALDLDQVQIDVLDVRRALAGGVANTSTEVLVEVATRFAGDFLEGLELDDCYGFAAWCIAEREALRAVRSSVLAELTRRCADPARALEHARAWVALDPVSEAAHIEVIDILGRLGRPRDALAQYNTIARILDSELRASPSPELEHARRQVYRAA